MNRRVMELVMTPVVVVADVDVMAVLTRNDSSIDVVDSSSFAVVDYRRLSDRWV